MQKKIWLDMDGTIADLYGVDSWLSMLMDNDPTPYQIAKPMVNMSSLARLLHKAQRIGYEIGIISWLSKNSNEGYDNAVTAAKLQWLEMHLPSVVFDNIFIVEYGTPKHEICKGFLFDDEENNRNLWGNGAFEPEELLIFLRNLV